MTPLELAPPPAVRKNRRSKSPDPDRLYTGTDLLNHPEWGNCELIRGKVVPVCRPKYRHGKLMNEIGRRMSNFCVEHKLGSVISGDSGIYLERGPDTVRGPDVYFISTPREPADPDGYLEVAPDLCVEIVSPNDRWSEVEEKINQFLKIGVKQIWVVDPGWRHAKVYRLNGIPSAVAADGVPSGEDVLPGFELPLKELFAMMD